jgi:hypothetical protein
LISHWCREKKISEICFDILCFVQVVPGRSIRSVVGDVEKMFDGEKPDITIDCSGAESSIRDRQSMRFKISVAEQEPGFGFGSDGSGASPKRPIQHTVDGFLKWQKLLHLIMFETFLF